jgi:hypothetical protein
LLLRRTRRREPRLQAEAPQNTLRGQTAFAKASLPIR